MEPSVNVNSDEVLPIMTAPSWMDPIWDYLLNGKLLSDSKAASKLRTKSTKFVLLRGTLYKRGFSVPLLKCVGKEDADYVLRKVHEGICGNHIGAQTLAGTVLRQGYYWPTMLIDATDLVIRCKIYQERAMISHLPSDPLTTIISPLAFSVVGIRHTRAPAHWKRPVLVHHCRSGLLHQVGRGRTISNKHRAKGA